MNEEKTSDRDILFSSIAANDSELSAILKKRRLYLRDIARLAVKEDRLDSPSSLNEIESETFRSYRERFDTRSPEAADADRFQQAGAMLADAVSIASLTTHMAKEMKLAPLSSPNTAESSRICYFRNIYSDSAYLEFAKRLNNASAHYTGDLTSACEEVYYGKADYCILPVESRSDGLMTRFIGLIQKYELYITVACRISREDGDFVTMFLLGASKTVPADPERIAISVMPDSDCPLRMLLTVVELLGAKLLTCSALPERIYSEEAYYLIFDIKSADLRVIELALQLTLSSWDELGVYKQTDAYLG